VTHRPARPLLAAGLAIAVIGLSPVLAAPAHAAPTCFGQRATLTDADARGGIIRGTARRDVVAVRDPHHAVFAGGGNDLVCGSAWVLAGDGDDRVLMNRRSEQLPELHGGPGRDRITVLSGQTAHLIGGDGNDLLRASAGRQYLRGGAGSDVLSGGRGPDDLDGNAGRDRAWGGDGVDSCRAETVRGCER
jgi:Ca2+-binding RTX toxin-like protein